MMSRTPPDWHDLASLIRLVARKVTVPCAGPITALTILASASDKPRPELDFLSAKCHMKVLHRI